MTSICKKFVLYYIRSSQLNTLVWDDVPAYSFQENSNGVDMF